MTISVSRRTFLYEANLLQYVTK